MNGLPSGGYLERDSRIHRMDARLKLVALIVGVVIIVLCSQWWMYLPVIAVIVAIGALSGLTATEVFMPLRRLWVFMVVIFVMNVLFFGEGGEVLFSFGPIAPTIQGVDQGGHVVATLALVLLWANLLTMTTPPVQLTGALAFLFGPLKAIGVPTRTLSLILSVAIQFIPTLIEEAQAIKNAQTARGARFESRNVLQRATAVVSLVVPIFVAAFRRADELSQAMEARGFRVDGR